MNFKRIAGFLGGVLITLSAFLSCTIGMGKSIDLEPPQLTVTNYMNGAKVGLEFDLSGICTDNVGVTKVTVKNVDNDFYFDDAVISGTSWKTHLSLTTDYEGERTFIITAEDAVGNVSSKSYAILVLSIDQTSPNDLDWYIDRGNAIRTEVAELADLKAKNLYISENKDIPQNEKFTVYGSLYDAMSINDATLGLYTVNGKLLIEKTYSSDPDDEENYIGADKSIFSPSFEFTHDELKDLVDDDGSKLESGLHYLWLKCYLKDEHGNDFSRDIGYMVWWPESDLPGIYQNDLDRENNTLSVLIDYSVPLDIFDDDGLDEIYYALKTDTVYSNIPGSSLTEKCQAVIDNEGGIRDTILNINAAQNEVGGSATDLASQSKRDNPVSIKTPSTPCTMYLIVCAKDIYDKWNCKIIYTTISDASSPMIFIESPRNNEKPQMNEGTNTFTIKGYSLGKNESSSLKLVYISGDDSSDTKKQLASAILDGTTEPDAAKGQILRTLSLSSYTMEDNLKKQTFETTFDILTELSQYKGENETSYFFMFRLQGTGTAVDTLYQLNKDVALPTITVDEPNNMQAIDYEKRGLTLKFKAEKDSGLTITDYKLSYGSSEWTYSLNKETSVWENNGFTKDGDWLIKEFTKADLVEIYNDTPQPQFDIWVKDALGYEATEQRTVVLTTLPALDEITSENPNGTYITGEVLTFQAKFSDAVRVSNSSSTKKPRLKIKYSDSDTVAKYAEYSSGSGTATLVFTYTVPENAESEGISIAALDENNTVIDLNGCKIVPVAAGDGDAYIVVPAGKNLDGKTLKLDGVAPEIKALNLACDASVNSDGNYYVKADNKLTVTVELSEKIFISGSPSLQMKVKKSDNTFANLVFDFSTINAEGNKLTFEHSVTAGDSGTANGTVYITKASCFDSTNLALISDVNGNALVLPTAADSASGIVVDTVKPAALTVAVTATKAPTITISGQETGCTVQYSLDNGITWKDYSSAVSITDDGSYKIIARQTDKAGNVSDLQDPEVITVDSAFPDIVDFTVSSPDGNYKVGSTIDFALAFSNKVIVSAGNTSTVTFESINTPAVTKTAKVITTESSGQNTVYFEYTVQTGDDLQGIKLVKVNYSGFTDAKGNSSGTVEKTDKTETRSGIILDGVLPALSSAAPAMTDKTSGFNGTTSGISTETDNSKFTITLKFAENVYKETGTIILQRKGDWAIPAVLDSEEFLSLYQKMDDTNKAYMMRTDASTGKELLHGKTGIAVGPYRRITQGLKQSGTGSSATFVPDETTKYVLAYELDLYSGAANLNDGTQTGTFEAKVSNIRDALESVNYHRHTVDVAGSYVKIYKDDGTTEVADGEGGKIVKITFSEAIEDGREWELIIPQTAFRDNAENFYKGMNLSELKAAEITAQGIKDAAKSASDTYSVWSNNVAQPVVRVDRYTHGWGAVEPDENGNLTTIENDNGKYSQTCAEGSAARIAPTGYARARIDCETPDVVINYKKINSAETTFDDSNNKNYTDYNNYNYYRSSNDDVKVSDIEFSLNSGKKTGGNAYTLNSNIIVGDSNYTSARKDYISCYATKDNFEESTIGVEGIFRTVVYVHTEYKYYENTSGTYLSINIEGGTSPGGQPNVDGFPLRDATDQNDRANAGRFSKNAYNLNNSQTPGQNFVFVSYEILSSNWAILVCRSNHAQDYPLNSYGDVAYIQKIVDWDKNFWLGNYHTSYNAY